MSDSVTLANILGSQASIQWFEAVAVVREIADRLLANASDRAIPELQQIRLSPEGYLDVAGLTPTDEPVRRMGQLLQALVAHTDVPVQLRLVISQATSPTPVYGSVRDYSEALGFFERPERSTVLNQLAIRVTSAVPSASSDGALTLDSLAPLPNTRTEEEEKKKHAPRPVSQGRSRGWGFAVVAAVLLSSGYGFASLDAKTSDYFFTGFPSYWNIVALYLYAARTPPVFNGVLLLALVVMVFVRIGYVYPSRTPVLQRTTNLLGVIWAVMMLAIVWLLPDAPQALVAGSLFFPVYYAALSFWLHARRRASA